MNKKASKILILLLVVLVAVVASAGFVGCSRSYLERIERRIGVSFPENTVVLHIWGGRFAGGADLVTAVLQLESEPTELLNNQNFSILDSRDYTRQDDIRRVVDEENSIIIRENLQELVPDLEYNIFIRVITRIWSGRSAVVIYFPEHQIIFASWIF